MRRASSGRILSRRTLRPSSVCDARADAAGGRRGPPPCHPPTRRCRLHRAPFLLAFLPRAMRSIAGLTSQKSLRDFWERSNAWGVLWQDPPSEWPRMAQA